MSDQKLLPVRLRPDAGEHFSAYLLRLAIANGRGSVREFFSTLNIKGTRAQNHQSSDTLITVAQWLGLSGAELESLIVRDETLAKVTPHDSTRIYRNLELRVPRVCTACLNEKEKRIPSYFGQLPFTHCNEHDHELIHACPYCNAPFTWSEELFDCKCPSCGVGLKDSTRPVQLPAYASALRACLIDTTGLNNFIRDLLLALQCVLEPLSSDLSARERPPTEVARWPLLLEQAYALLNDSTAMESWVEACWSHRSATASIGASAIYLPIYALKEKLGLPWPLRVFDCLAGRHSVNEPAEDNANPMALVDHRLLSQVLGCEATEILPLLESAAIQGLIGHKSVRDSRFDLVELAKQIEQLDSDASGSLTDMEHAARIAAAHGGNLGHVLAGILLNEVPFKPNPERNSLLDGARVGTAALLAWMERHLASLENAQCPLLQTIAIIGMNKQEITQACSLGLLKPLGWRRELYFLGGDISRLLAGHTSIKRWSKIAGIPIRQLRADLQASDFDAAIDGVLYTRTKELESHLNSLTGR
ncbi:TniQ family protein [Pseudomonas sp. NPDC077186]|uniref:TniQ family protein n=1 Tax=Pseudomonas sp. NPDC077186 TaxID=3364421 RepID=UPI0037C5DF4A